MLCLQNTLPDNYNYHVQPFEAVDEDVVQASIRIALTTPEEAAAWVTAYEAHNKCTFHVFAKPRVTGENILFKLHVELRRFVNNSDFIHVYFCEAMDSPTFLTYGLGQLAAASKCMASTGVYICDNH